MRQVLLVGSLLVASASIGVVAQLRYVTDAPGRWKPWTFNVGSDGRTQFGARPADLKALEAHLLRLNEIIKGTADMANPIGFSIDTSGSFSAPPRSTPFPGEPTFTARPLPATYYFGAFAIIEYGSGASIKREDGGETALLPFLVNDLSAPLVSARNNRIPEFEKIDVDVVRLARPEPDVFGLPRYGSNAIVIKKTDAEIWAPVSMGETLDLVARSVDQRLADQRNSVARQQAGYDDQTDPAKRAKRMAEYKELAALQADPAAFMAQMAKVDAQLEQSAAALLPHIAKAKEEAAKIEQELADVRAKANGLSAAEKAAPACYVSDSPSGTLLVSRFRPAPQPVSQPGCDLLVRPNWSLFNPALPRSAPQVLVISSIERCLDPDRKDPHPGSCNANLRLLKAIDKAALLAWLQ